VADAKHPLVERILRAAAEFRRDRYLVGITDGREHPVYQTKWLKFGLRALGLDDPYGVPATLDSYSTLFWMDYRDQHVEGPPFGEGSKVKYPYLGWAEAHFHGWEPPTELAGDTYPLTWEAHASQADYERMAVVSPQDVEQRVCRPHAWHAAEMFLYLWELGQAG